MSNTTEFSILMAGCSDSVMTYNIVYDTWSKLDIDSSFVLYPTCNYGHIIIVS